MDSILLLWQNLTSITVSDIIDIAVVSFLIYQVVKLVRETSSARIIRGVIVLIVAMWISNILQLTMVNYLFQTVLTWGILVIAIVFQPELRRVLERVGKSKLSSLMLRNDTIPVEEKAVLEIVHACSEMSWSRTGALIIFERKESLEDVIRTGTIVNADVKDELVRNIFYEGAPLHDGAMIIRGGRVHAAGCVLPLSPNPNLAKELGTRHRAAVGMSENADSVSLVVSEETGSISIAIDGQLQRHLVPEQLDEILRTELLVKEELEQQHEEMTVLAKIMDKIQGFGGKKR
ncbi:diadenylate cyclase CdaA [Butyricicoccus porcorum]|uniref:Diadenylate cyclase n=1 Tax=Butyricicoccus porcorum TaxID=1945634 RepID=A0A252F6J2_9FIRM|nr:diadenylate cyclase CdaA [Butyricicoccus porcorum]MCI6925528.1 diadenylate cyclase CdaA [Butyricicoccus porcorum]MDD6986346.1 diadenylate cyclase CdaA [Butyricicoccus porcorum]MDY4483649.1 diadenylate cyclase CdaA [Butyricicoccus porcorum]OUM21393.1 TIGR00159 family protein [Butyricicoccus porcorum]